MTGILFFLYRFKKRRTKKWKKLSNILFLVSSGTLIWIQAISLQSFVFCPFLFVCLFCCIALYCLFLPLDCTSDGLSTQFKNTKHVRELRFKTKQSDSDAMLNYCSVLSKPIPIIYIYGFIYLSMYLYLQSLYMDTHAYVYMLNLHGMHKEIVIVFQGKHILHELHFPQN